MFTEKCLLRMNNSFIRRILKAEGFKVGNSQKPWLKCEYGVITAIPDTFTEDLEDYIDCDTKICLFVQLAHLQDDNDYLQLFKNDRGATYLCHKKHFSEIISKCDALKEFKKLDSKMLIEHFHLKNE